MSRSEDSIRPSRTNNSVDVGGGLGGGAGRQRRGVEGRRGAKLCATFDDACPCCPIAQGDAQVGGAAVAPNVDVEAEELIATEEQEPAEMPLVLPQVYQPTRSEYLDHCVTHYPFRAWCKHCLEGRGREFGHEHGNGTKDERSTPVVSFDYCFIGDSGDVKSGVSSKPRVRVRRSYWLLVMERARRYLLGLCL